MTHTEMIEALLAQCAEDRNTQESPRGSNRGKRVEQMLRYTGLGGGYPWCAAAVATWGVEALGESWPVPRSADCDALLAWAKRRVCLHASSPQRGDIFLVMKSADDAIHTGIVSSVIDENTIQTWEGNTNNDGSREGYRVCYRTRTRGSLVYVRWADVTESSAPRLLETPAYQVWVSPYGLFPKIQMRSGRPCAPVRQFVAAILGMSLENTKEIVGWLPPHVTINGRSVHDTYLVTEGDRSTAWAPVREIAEALGCVVTVDGTEVRIEPRAGGK